MKPRPGPEPREAEPRGTAAGGGGTPLSPSELLRYSRHLVLPEVGLEGQARLKASSVLVVGAGGLGSPVALYLAAAGVGRLGLVDFDRVDVSNLQRQVLFGSASLVDAARERLADLNPEIRIETHEVRLTSQNALELLGGYDVIVDGTDNFPTRYLVNDACVMLAKPNVHGSIFRFEGQAAVFDATRGPCYRCLYPDPPPPGMVPSCAEGGVLGVLPGVIGVIQAIETIKLVLGRGDILIGRLLLFDAWSMSFRELQVRKDPDCPRCGTHPDGAGLIDYEQFCGLTPAENAMAGAAAWEIGARDLKALLDRGEVTLVDVREPHEAAIARVAGSVLIPLRTLPDRLSELDRGREIVLMCHHGQRSQRALDLLRESGFVKLKNLRGGIDAWSRDVDSAVARY